MSLIYNTCSSWADQRKITLLTCAMLATLTLGLTGCGDKNSDSPTIADPILSQENGNINEFCTANPNDEQCSESFNDVTQGTLSSIDPYNPTSGQTCFDPNSCPNQIFTAFPEQVAISQVGGKITRVNPLAMCDRCGGRGVLMYDSVGRLVCLNIEIEQTGYINQRGYRLETGLWTGRTVVTQSNRVQQVRQRTSILNSCRSGRILQYCSLAATVNTCGGTRSVCVQTNGLTNYAPQVGTCSANFR